MSTKKTGGHITPLRKRMEEQTDIESRMEAGKVEIMKVVERHLRVRKSWPN